MINTHDLEIDNGEHVAKTDRSVIGPTRTAILCLAMSLVAGCLVGDDPPPGADDSGAADSGGNLAASACTYYIAPTGSDTAAGSLDKPWKTINYASAKLHPGQTLCARGGTYVGQAGYIWHSSGTSTQPVTFKNYPGETPIFDGGWGDTGTDGDFLVLSNNSWVVVDGITIQHFVDQYGNGAIDIWNGRGPVENITIQNCTFRDNGSTHLDHHIYLGQGATNITIRNNLMMRAAGGAVHAYHTPVSKGIKVYNNVIVGGTLSCSQSHSNPCASTATATWGIILGDASDAQVYNNTIYGEQRGIDFYYGASTSAHGPYVVKNNMIVNSTDFGLRIGSAYAPYVSSDYNLFYGNRTDVVYGNSSWTLAQFAANTPNDRHSLKTNPAFVSAGSDFHLNANSPAIDRGVTVSLLSTDKDWHARPSGASYDIGAYEFSVAGSAPALTVSVSSLDFGSVNVGSSSAVKLVTVTNTGTATLSFHSPTYVGDFPSANVGSCTPTLAAGASCTYSLKFTPTATGARTGSLVINSDAPPATVVLSGTGS